MPSPCGPNSQCRVVNGQGVCSCLPEYTGTPPMCRPECVVNSECPQDRACINQKCVNPCPASCGMFATCVVRNHSPICACRESYTGDPFTRCFPVPRKIFASLSVQTFMLYNLSYCNCSFRSYATYSSRNFTTLFAFPVWSKFGMSCS